MDQPGNVANPTRGQLNREMNVSLSPFAPENLDSRDEFGRPVPRQHAHSPHSVGLNMVLTRGIPPDFRGGVHLFMLSSAIGSVPSLSGHAIACRSMVFTVESPPARASSPQGSSRSNGCCCLFRYHHPPNNEYLLSFAIPTTVLV